MKVAKTWVNGLHKPLCQEQVDGNSPSKKPGPGQGKARKARKTPVVKKTVPKLKAKLKVKDILPSPAEATKPAADETMVSIKHFGMGMRCSLIHL